MDRDELIARVEAGESIDYLFFWGHRQKEKAQIDASCLSQWFPASFVIDATSSGGLDWDATIPTRAIRAPGADRTCSDSR